MPKDQVIWEKSVKSINEDKTIDEREKKRRIKTVKSLLDEGDVEKRYSKLYDMICDYLDEEFRSKNICDFKGSLCVRRRNMIAKGIKKDTYENGCCHGYKEKHDCEHLCDGHCSIKNIACKIFTCPFLKKKGIHYSLNQIYFAKYFLNYRQKFYAENTFFVDKSVVLKGILERM